MERPFALFGFEQKNSGHNWDDAGYSETDRTRQLRQSLVRTLVTFGTIIVLFTLALVLATASHRM